MVSFFIAIFLLALVSVSGAVHKSEWVDVGGKYYYYNAKGTKLKGLRKIGNRYYYFDSNCVQRTGWRKISGNYYYFVKSTKTKGYMAKNRTINGVKIGQDGKAILNARSLRKLKIMVRCSEIVDSLTNADQSGSQRLKIVFEYAKNHYRPVNIGKFNGSGDWDMYYAERMLNYGSGDCYCYAAIFAYLADAVGYHKVIVVSSGGHGWAELNGKVYDANWARVIGSDKCYAVPKSLSGVAGRPAWAKYGYYKKYLNQ